jgi:GNAT superfamily N-acetyltransferase
MRKSGTLLQISTKPPRFARWREDVSQTALPISLIVSPFEQFLDETYGEGGSMSRELLDTNIEWLIADVGGKIIGYAKLRPLVAPAPNPKKGALELQQIYVLREWHGRGVAERLMHWALDRARTLGGPEIYLTVFDQNERAKRFYIRHGFIEVGHCSFELGSRTYDDRVWWKILY